MKSFDRNDVIDMYGPNYASADGLYTVLDSDIERSF